MTRIKTVVVGSCLALALWAGIARADQSPVLETSQAPAVQCLDAALQVSPALPAQPAEIPAWEAKIKCAPITCSSDEQCEMQNGSGSRCVGLGNPFVCPYCN